ncbi:MerR family transcriptional regulator [Clostridium sp. SYSU_GA19001]|uniref:MerR family transcriptional regulator n=1 Tax=Clostridium caldaquaticum TaxID=2940653 RepID=UPI002076DF49|nr:MerR family transcriptional regulator [Clostridium caldaquaticum]MCM8709442.1 MerR family transcriptional regulator [Clostridium caldaquaticum]
MLIKDVCRECKLTKKAVEYYEQQGLIYPRLEDNGYRNYSYEDIDEYKKSPDWKIQQLLLKFQQESGYYDIFIENLKILSDSYREYFEKTYFTDYSLDIDNNGA